VYSAAKAALETLTEALAYELFPQGVRVNCVRLGWVPGEMFLYPELAKLDRKTATRLRDDIMAEHIREIRKSLPCAKGEEAAAVVAFLASPAARFVNGAILHADGGYGAAILRASERALQEQSLREGPGVSERWSKDSAAELAAWRKKRAL
jgi:NAD(P)-dependent dehydrogenase (short-subunit alcohol dehydrogenase family)